MIEIAPDSPRGYTIVAKQEWELNGRIDESIRWESKALAIDPQDPGFPTNIGLAYSALGDPDMALAYFDLAKALTASDNEPAQKKLLLEQAIVKLVSGKIDPHQAAEQPIPLNTPPTTYSAIPTAGMRLGVFVDLATGRAADALARMEVFSPDCIGALESKFGRACPDELVRVYQELGDHEAAQALSDANVSNWQSVVDEYPVPWVQKEYAGTLSAAGRTDAVFDVLENLVSSGWRGDYFNKHLGFTLCCDVRFDAIRDHERFRAITATIEADMAQQLENVREMQRRGELPTLEEVNTLIASVQERG
jgi:tetratricopeptide (TPR) repeat protein